MQKQFFSICKILYVIWQDCLIAKNSILLLIDDIMISNTDGNKCRKYLHREEPVSVQQGLKDHVVKK